MRIPVTVLLLLTGGCQVSPETFRNSMRSAFSGPPSASAEFAGEPATPHQGRTEGPDRRTTENAAENRTSADESVSELLQRAHRLAAREEFARARRLYRQVLDRQPDHPAAHHRLAIIADKRGEYRAAEQHYRTALEERPTAPDLYSDLGYSYLRQERYRESRQALQRALQLDPAHVRALNNLGLLYARQGDYDQALKMFRQAGSEKQAQKKMAVLFPDGPPQQTATSDPLDSNRTAGNDLPNLRPQDNREPSGPNGRESPGEPLENMFSDGGGQELPALGNSGAGSDLLSQSRNGAAEGGDHQRAPAVPKGFVSLPARQDVSDQQSVDEIPSPARSAESSALGPDELWPPTMIDTDQGSETTQQGAGRSAQPAPAARSNGSTSQQSLQHRAAVIGLQAGPGLLWPMIAETPGGPSHAAPGDSDAASGHAGKAPAVPFARSVPWPRREEESNAPTDSEAGTPEVQNSELPDPLASRGQVSEASTRRDSGPPSSRANRRRPAGHVSLSPPDASHSGNSPSAESMNGKTPPGRRSPTLPRLGLPQPYGGSSDDSRTGGELR